MGRQSAQHNRSNKGDPSPNPSRNQLVTMSSGRPYVGYVDPNFPSPMGPGDASIIIYGYTPNFTLCILGIVFFTVLFFAHLFQTIRVRLWSFVPLLIARVMEVVGYAFRALSSRKNPYHVSYFVVQYFMIVTAPVLTSASIYVCLTKVLVWAADEGLDLSTKTVLLRRKVVLWTFITIDVFCTILQITGAGLIGGATSNGKDPSSANNILLAGMAQKAGKNPFLGVLALASTLIFIRTIFRLAETSQGVFGHLSSHEEYFAGLEFAPVVAAVTILAVWFPSRWPVVAGRVKIEGV